MEQQEELREWQRKAKLVPDGILGPKTWNAMHTAMLWHRETARLPSWVPMLPNWSPLAPSQSIALFGDPRRDSPLLADGSFHVVPEFFQKLIRFEVAGRDGLAITGLPKLVQLHERAVQPFLDLWRDWKSSDLLRKLRTWGGSVAFRATRIPGSTRVSQHAYGVAFDINVPWNRFGDTPAAPWVIGSVMEMVPLANAHGWFWGGHFGYPDGMHFELTVVK